MTVKDLIEALEQFPPDLQIIISKDSEGNAYSPADVIEPNRYIPDTPWSGRCSTGRLNAVVVIPLN